MGRDLQELEGDFLLDPDDLPARGGVDPGAGAGGGGGGGGGGVVSGGGVVFYGDESGGSEVREDSSLFSSEISVALILLSTDFLRKIRVYLMKSRL